MDGILCGSPARVYGSMVDFADVAHAGLFMRAFLLPRGSVEGARAFVVEENRRRDLCPDTRRCGKSEMAWGPIKVMEDRGCR